LAYLLAYSALVATPLTRRGCFGTASRYLLPLPLLGIISAISGTLTHIGSDLIHWQALLTIISGSLISAPFGARLTHRLPIHKLKKWFSLLITTLGMVMISRSIPL
jgi:hypothetical protein